MKTLLLMRHAKSSWQDEGVSDHERPLNKRGERDAPRIGSLIAEQDLCPDLIICSTAVRARTTAQAVAHHCGHGNPIRLEADFYLAAPHTYIETFGLLPDAIDRVMAVGHNPGMAQLLWKLTGADKGFPTAGLAHIDLPIDAWQEFSEATRGELVNYWRPREL